MRLVIELDPRLDVAVGALGFTVIAPLEKHELVQWRLEQPLPIFPSPTMSTAWTGQSDHFTHLREWWDFRGSNPGPFD